MGVKKTPVSFGVLSALRPDAKWRYLTRPRIVIPKTHGVVHIDMGPDDIWGRGKLRDAMAVMNMSGVIENNPDVKALFSSGVPFAEALNMAFENRRKHQECERNKMSALVSDLMSKSIGSAIKEYAKKALISFVITSVTPRLRDEFLKRVVYTAQLGDHSSENRHSIERFMGVYDTSPDIKVLTKFTHFEAIESSDVAAYWATYGDRTGAEKAPKRPVSGTSFFTYRGTLFWVNVWSTKSRDFGIVDAGSALHTIGSGRKYIDELMELIGEDVAKKEESPLRTIPLYKLTPNSSRSSDRPVAVVPCRDAGALMISDSVKKGFVDEIRSWLDQEKACIDKGIPWRTGFQLVGPAGTGKTTLARIISRYFGMRLYITDPRDFTADEWINALINLPKKSVVLIEDIDNIKCLKPRKGTFDHEGGDTEEDDDKDLILPKGSMDLDAFINGIDGPIPTHGLIIIATTNKIDLKLDKAVTRAGRLSHRVVVDKVVDKEIKNYLTFMYGAEYDLKDLFSSLTFNPTTGAVVEEAYLRNMKNPDGAVSEIGAIVHEKMA